MSDNMKKFGWPLLIIAVGVIIAFFLIISRPTARTQDTPVVKPLVRYEAARPREVTVTIQAQGTVTPLTQGPLISEVNGRIIKTAPEFAAGGYFEKGQTMLWIDPAEYQLAREQARLQVAQAELALAREQQEADIAREEWQKVGRGEPDSLVLRLPQLKQARAALEAARAALRLAELNLSRTAVKAPYACRMRDKQAALGQVITRGTPLATIYAIDYAEVRLPLTDEQLAFIDIPLNYHWDIRGEHQPAVTIRASFAGREYQWPARLIRIEGEIDPMTRMIFAVARIRRPFDRHPGSDNPPLTVGMFVDADITGKTLKNVFVVDENAVHNRNRLWVIDGQNRLRIRPVTIVRREPGRVIISSGLNPGEKICLTPLNTVVDGMSVLLAESTTPEREQSHE